MLNDGKAKHGDEPSFILTDDDRDASQHYNRVQCTQSMLNCIEWVLNSTKYTYIAARLTGTLAKCQSKRQRIFRRLFL